MVEGLWRDYLPNWLPQALATIASGIYALGGQHVEWEALLAAWGLTEEKEAAPDFRGLEQWLGDFDHGEENIGDDHGARGR